MESSFLVCLFICLLGSLVRWLLDDPRYCQFLYIFLFNSEAYTMPEAQCELFAQRKVNIKIVFFNVYALKLFKMEYCRLNLLCLPVFSTDVFMNKRYVTYILLWVRFLLLFMQMDFSFLFNSLLPILMKSHWHSVVYYNKLYHKYIHILVFTKLCNIFS